jgi:hypothetical protein
LNRIFLTLIAGLTLMLAGCDEPRPSADQKMNAQQEHISAEGASQVGMPAIVNFQEKRMMKQIVELRDSALSTTTYTQDMSGKLHFFCDSVGYGLPGATQYTSPQKESWRSYGGGGGHYVVLPQADPNGLFSPATTDATWVLCRDPNADASKNKGVLPVYVEPHVIVSPFKLKAAE